MWHIFITKSQDSVVLWNVNDTVGSEVITNSECVIRLIPLMFVSFSQCVVGDVISYCSSKLEVGLLNSWHVK